jgi:hypothetical protein
MQQTTQTGRRRRANKSVPTTQMQQAMSSPVAAGIAAGLGAGTAGLDDVVGRNILGPEWDANRQALAATNRKSDLVGMSLAVSLECMA